MDTNKDMRTFMAWRIEHMEARLEGESDVVAELALLGLAFEGKESSPKSLREVQEQIGDQRFYSLVGAMATWVLLKYRGV